MRRLGALTRFHGEPIGGDASRGTPKVDKSEEYNRNEKKAKPTKKKYRGESRWFICQAQR